MALLLALKTGLYKGLKHLIIEGDTKIIIQATIFRFCPNRKLFYVLPNLRTFFTYPEGNALGNVFANLACDRHTLSY